MARATPRWCHRCRVPHSGSCPSVRAKDLRPSASERGYGSAWRKWRELYLRRNPLCADCKPVLTPAQDVHHINKIADGGALMDPGNCMALCHVCHSVRTRRGE